MSVGAFMIIPNISAITTMLIFHNVYKWIGIPLTWYLGALILVLAISLSGPAYFLPIEPSIATMATSFVGFARAGAFARALLRGIAGPEIERADLKRKGRSASPTERKGWRYH